MRVRYHVGITSVLRRCEGRFSGVRAECDGTARGVARGLRDGEGGDFRRMTRGGDGGGCGKVKWGGGGRRQSGGGGRFHAKGRSSRWCGIVRDAPMVMGAESAI
jgi:hypothetical protein